MRESDYLRKIEEHFIITRNFERVCKLYKTYSYSYRQYLEVEEWLEVFEAMGFNRVSFDLLDKTSSKATYFFEKGQSSFEVQICYNEMMQLQSLEYFSQGEKLLSFRSVLAILANHSALNWFIKQTLKKSLRLPLHGIEHFFTKYLLMKSIKELQKTFNKKNNFEVITCKVQEGCDRYEMKGRLNKWKYELRMNVKTKDDAIVGFLTGQVSDELDIYVRVFSELEEEFLKVGFAMSSSFSGWIMSRILVNETIENYENTKEYKMKNLFIIFGQKTPTSSRVAGKWGMNAFLFN